MIKKRHQKGTSQHFCLLVNKEAYNYDRDSVTALINAIRSKGWQYTVCEPDSASFLLRTAEQAVGRRKRTSFVSQAVSRRGNFTSLIACGGDGTFNLVARAALYGQLPIGILPLGKVNNIALSILNSNDPKKAIDTIVKSDYRKIDVGQVANQMFFGSVGIGFIPNLTDELDHKDLPKFGIGWSKIGSKAAADVAITPMNLKVDAFRFDINPIMLNINLLQYSSGLRISPASIIDDGQAEIIFDIGDKVGEFGQFTRKIYKEKYLYGDEIRMYRGKTITCQPTAGKKLYLDGELIDIPTNLLEIQIIDDKLKIYS